MDETHQKSVRLHVEAYAGGILASASRGSPETSGVASETPEKGPHDAGPGPPPAKAAFGAAVGWKKIAVYFV